MPTDKPFLRDDGRVLTYAQLLGRVNATRDYVPVLKTGDLFLLAENFVRALATDSDLVLLDSDLTDTEIQSLQLDGVNEKAAVKNPRAFENLDALFAAIKASRSALTLFTSGTTGLPKKVTHWFSALLERARVKEGYDAHVWGLAYNPTHMAGLQVLLQVLLNRSGAVNLFGKPRQFVLEQIAHCAITHLSATPTFYRMLLPAPKTYPSVQRATFGGEKSDAALYEKIRALFPNAKVNNIYASTEGGALLASSGEFFKIPDALSDKIKITDGELLVHKDLLGQSQTFALAGDFYKTGDQVQFDESDPARFKFLGRKSSLLNVGGYKVNLEEVEDALRALAQVADARVYGKANSVLGNILCADIRLNEGASLEISELRTALSGRLQDFKIPRKISFVDSLQSTHTGKLKRT